MTLAVTGDLSNDQLLMQFFITVLTISFLLTLFKLQRKFRPGLAGFGLGIIVALLSLGVPCALERI